MTATSVRREIPLNRIDKTEETYRFRLDIPKDEIEFLMKNMQLQGLINPIKVRKKNDKYQMIAGWERMYSADPLGWETILADVYIDLTDEDAYKINMADNLIKSPLSSLEVSNMMAEMK
jgi:ParB family chromosome partitioning protein